jgi:hypothetical protein
MAVNLEKSAYGNVSKPDEFISIPQIIKSYFKDDLMVYEFNRKYPSYDRFKKWVEFFVAKKIRLDEMGFKSDEKTIQITEWYESWIEKNQSYYYKNKMREEIES